MAQVLSQIQTELGPKGFQAVGAGFTEDASALLTSFKNQTNHNFPVGYIEYSKAIAYAQENPNKRGVLPMILFLDRNFNVRSQFSQSDPLFQDPEKNFRARINELLNESAAPKRDIPVTRTKTPE